MEKQCVFCAVGTEFSYIFTRTSDFKRIKVKRKVHPLSQIQIWQSVFRRNPFLQKLLWQTKLNVSRQTEVGKDHVNSKKIKLCNPCA
jgi:hypothetical protein